MKLTLVVNAIIKRSNKFLIIKRSKDSEIHPGKWTFPGGKVEEGETLLVALKREVAEETDLDIDNNMTYISDYIYNRKDGSETLGISFLVKSYNSNVKVGIGVMDFKWVSIEEAQKYDLAGDIEEEMLKAMALDLQ